jgi:hypothetical protein
VLLRLLLMKQMLFVDKIYVYDTTDCHVAITILEIKRVKILTFKIFHPILMQFVFCKMMGYCFHYKKNLPILYKNGA